MRLFLLALFLVASAFSQTVNQLTDDEKKAGWILLFDGTSFHGWVDPNLKQPPARAWTISDGCIKTVPHAAMREDLMSVEKFRDFELAFDWKVAPGANSGVKYRIQDVVLMDRAKVRMDLPFEQRVEFEYQNRPSKREAIPTDGGYEEYPVAFEYQVIDSAHHPDAMRGPKYRAAALYGMAPPAQSADRPVGEWNSSRLVVRGKNIEHWLNGVKVVDTQLDAPQVRESIEKRWKDAPGIRKLLLDLRVAESPVALQHHVDEAWFRSIKIRRLD